MVMSCEPQQPNGEEAAGGCEEAATAAAEAESSEAAESSAKADRRQRPEAGGSGDEASCPKSPRPDDCVPLKVIYNKRKIDVEFPLSEKVDALKRRLQEVTGVPVAMQKLMFRGLCPDERPLRELGVSAGAKLMLVGSTPDSIMTVLAPQPEEAEQPRQERRPETRLCQREQHRRVLDKYGRPDDLAAAAPNRHEPLPRAPISGMYNKQGAKVRLTFKLEIDELWIGTKERTNKIPMSSIRRVVSEPIDSDQSYHIMGIQLGPTEQSMYWLYWVPCQFVRAVKSTIGSS